MHVKGGKMVWSLIVIVLAIVGFYFWSWIGAISLGILGLFIALENRKKGLRLAHFDRDYYEALFAVLGKMTIADGIIDKEEERHIEQFMDDTLHLSEGEQEMVMEYFNDAMKEDAPPLEVYVKKFLEVSAGDMTMHNAFLALVVALSIVDGRLSASEELILKKLEGYLSMPKDSVEILLNQYGYSLHEQPDANMDSYYEILGLTSDATLDEVLLAYEKKSATITAESESSSRLPKELQPFSHTQFNKLRGACESIKRQSVE